MVLQLIWLLSFLIEGKSLYVVIRLTLILQTQTCVGEITHIFVNTCKKI